MIQKQKKSSKCSKRKNFKIYWDRVFLVIFIPIIFATAIYNAAIPRNIVEYEERIVTVKSGDTLWTIAKDAIGETEDVRQTIHEIMVTNKLPDGNIRPGMKLKIRAIKE